MKLSINSLKGLTKSAKPASAIATAFLIAPLLLCCRGSVGSDSHLANLRYGKSSHPGVSSSDATITHSKNMQEEMAVVEEIRKAWKLAAVEKDREGALKILSKLDKEHPKISTVQMMMGQVEELFGNHIEAAKHFRKAHNVNEFSSMQTYKLAESLRRSGDAKGSIVYYEKLERRLESAIGEFKREEYKYLLGSVRLGMAQAMLDSDRPAEDVIGVLDKLKDFDTKTKQSAVPVVEGVIKKYPDNQDAKSLLKIFRS